MQGYPTNDAMHDDELAKKEAVGIAMSVLRTLMRVHPPGACKIMTKPARAVIADCKFDVGQYTGVPVPSNTNADCERSNKQLFVELKAFEMSIPLLRPVPVKVTIQVVGLTTDSASQYGTMQRNAKQEKSNCEVKEESVRLRLPTEKDQNKNDLRTIKVPIIVNTKVIGIGDELVLYAPELAAHTESKKANKVVNSIAPMLEPVTKGKKPRAS